MGMIDQDTIEQVKAKADVFEVVSEYVKLRKNGANYVGLCPFHNEKSPSFTVNKPRGIYKCFGCGRSGDAIQFLIDHLAKSYVEAIKELAAKYNISIEETGPRKEYVRPVERLEKLDKKKLEFFENKRLISNDTLLRMKITESNEWMPQFPDQKSMPVICFNYYRKGELINIKFRGPEKSFRLNKDSELIFYNIDSIDGEDEAVIVEGEIDTLTLVECGIYNVIGVPNGTPPKNTRLNLEYLNNCWQEISKLKSVIIAVDNDEVGKHLKEELGRRIGKEKCKIVVYPQGCKDPNDILKNYGKQGVCDFIEGAKAWPIDGLVTMDDQFEELVDYYENGYPLGYASGLPGMDALLTFYPGQLTMITGIPGHGKDEVANDLMVRLSERHGIIWGVVGFEEKPAIHSTKLSEKRAKKAFAFRKEKQHRMTREQFDEAIGFIDHHFKQIDPAKVEVTMDGLITKLEELVLRYGITGVAINPWNYIEHNLRPGQSETHYVSEQLTKFVNFLDRYGLIGFLFAHPTKINKDKKTGKFEIPTLYSISGSAHFFNKTHNGICVYRHYEHNVTEIYVQKVKFYWLGQIGWSSYKYNVDTRQYEFMDTSVFKQPEPVQKYTPPGLNTGNWKQIEIDEPED